MSRVTKLLMPLSYINEACFLSTNIDEKKIKPALAEAQMDLRAEVSRARTYEQLAEIARKRGYKPGWARVMFEVRNKKKI